MSFSFKQDRPYRIFLNALKILTYSKAQQDVIFIFHKQALIMKSNSLSERSQAIFNRQFFETYECPEEIVFNDRNAFVVSSRHLIRALDIPKFMNERIVSVEKQPTRTVFWVTKRLNSIRVRIKIDINESDENDFNQHTFESYQTPPLLCMESSIVRSMHQTFKNCVSNLESNVLIDVHPSLGLRVKSLGIFEVETFFQRTSFKGSYAPADRVIIHSLSNRSQENLASLVSMERAKLERGFQLKLQLTRLMRAGAMAEIQKHDVRLYVEKLIKEDRAINLAYLVVGSIKNYELLISSNSNLREKDLTRDDSFKKTQTSSFSEHAPSLSKLMQLSQVPRSIEPQFKQPLPRTVNQSSFYQNPDLQEIKEVKKEEGTPEEVRPVRVVDPSSESLDMSNSLPMLPPHQWTIASHSSKDDLQVKKEDSDQQQFLMSILLEDDENEDDPSLYQPPI